MVSFWSLGEIFGDDDDHRGACADGDGDCMVVIIVILMIIMVVMMMVVVVMMMMVMMMMIMMMKNGFKQLPDGLYIYIYTHHSNDLVEVPPGPMSLDFIARIVCGISMNFPKLPPICLSIEDV